jgi:hypothetical protein
MPRVFSNLGLDLPQKKSARQFPDSPSGHRAVFQLSA